MEKERKIGFKGSVAAYFIVVIVVLGILVGYSHFTRQPPIQVKTENKSTATVNQKNDESTGVNDLPIFSKYSGKQRRFRRKCPSRNFANRLPAYDGSFSRWRFSFSTAPRSAFISAKSLCRADTDSSGGRRGGFDANRRRQCRSRICNFCGGFARSFPNKYQRPERNHCFTFKSGSRFGNRCRQMGTRFGFVYFRAWFC